MTNAQKAFCDEYLVDFNATRAYKAVYKNCKTDGSARACASELLTKPNIKEYIEKGKKAKAERCIVTQDMVLEELKKIGFANMKQVFNENGGLKNIQDMDSDVAAAICSIESFEEFNGYGADREYIGDTKKIKMLDKTKALELIGKHLGMFKDKLEIESDKPFEINIKVVKNGS